MKNSLYLIYGTDSYKKEKYIKKLKAEILDNSDEKLNFDKLEGDKIDPNILQDTLERVPFLGDRRLILIEKAPFFGGKVDDKVAGYLKNYFENPVTTNIVVFVTEKVDKRSKLYKKIKEKGEVVELELPKQREVEELTKKKIKSMGLNFDREAFDLLLQNTGSNMSIIEKELEKLSLGVNEKVTASIVEKYVPASIESNIFKFVDKLGNEKEIEKAVRELRELLLNEPLQRVYYMVTRQFRLLYKVKLFLNKKYPEDKISRELKLPPFVVKKLISQSKKFSQSYLSNKIIELVELDYYLKTSAVLEEKYVLERIIIDSVIFNEN